MNDIKARRYLLHVSDFHLNEDESMLKHAKAGLTAMVKKLQEEKIIVDYLVHTGDVIDSSDLYVITAEAFPECHKFIKEVEVDGTKIRTFDSDAFRISAERQLKEKFDSAMQSKIEKRFKKAESVMKDFISDLNVAPGNVVICCGNHDVLRPFSVDQEAITCHRTEKDNWTYECGEGAEGVVEPFEDFLDSLNVANSRKRHNSDEPITSCRLGNMNILILNTNWLNHKKQKAGYYCIRCDKINSSLDELNFYKGHSNELNIVVAHKPIYEICERPRLPYKRYIMTSFMSRLHKFLGDNGVYLCGDKHTRSIGDDSFHSIKHYIGGEPLRISTDGNASETEYNLLEVSTGRIGIERKIHLISCEETCWNCTIRPQDAVVSHLYDTSKMYISQSAFRLIGSHESFYTWDSVCQDIYNWGQKKRHEWAMNLNSMYRAICKYRKYGLPEYDLLDKKELENTNIFEVILGRIIDQIRHAKSRNILNVRGGYATGKSTFLGLLYMYLMYKYSVGEIDFIPAYFNLENDEMVANIEDYSSYYEAARNKFKGFFEDIQKIANKEDQRICYIVDGEDEQDCWSYSSQDSIGRGLLDVLAEHDNSWYIMSFSQHRLPCFKNTMPIRKYGDASDIMYFNPVDVRAALSPNKHFVDFVAAFLRSMKQLPESPESKRFRDSRGEIHEIEPVQISADLVNGVCDLIRKFRRLTITPGFMNQNIKYIAAINAETQTLQYKDASVSNIYRYYIDRQEEICLEELGYGFVHYAPAMAYLFTFKGYTYERFKSIGRDESSPNRHIFSNITDNRSKVYRTFLFIKECSDAREYLIALHYNRELRYYAENPVVKIAEDSILNEFITRNIAVLIRKLWSDTNKFVIVCNELLQRKELSNCLQSMLIYCLAHMDMYKPIRDSLWNKLCGRAKKTLEEQHSGCSWDQISWKIEEGDSYEKLKKFIDLGLLHTLWTYEDTTRGNTVKVAKKLFYDETAKDDQYYEFGRYNRQYQMLYYGDLFIRGEYNQPLLDPDDDKIDKGFDFHTCYHHLIVKLNSQEQYYLREFDMCTVLDLILTRINPEYIEGHCRKVISIKDTFFQRESFKEKASEVIEEVTRIVNDYLHRNKYNEASLNFIRESLGKITAQWNKDEANGSTDSVSSEVFSEGFTTEQCCTLCHQPEEPPRQQTAGLTDSNIK